MALAFPENISHRSVLALQVQSFFLRVAPTMTSKCFVKVSKGSFKKYVRWERGEGGHWKTNKNEHGEGEGVLACVYVRFFKKHADIFKMKFESYSPVFPIDYNGSMKY